MSKGSVLLTSAGRGNWFLRAQESPAEEAPGTSQSTDRYQPQSGISGMPPPLKFQLLDFFFFFFKSQILPIDKFCGVSKEFLNNAP